MSRLKSVLRVWPWLAAIATGVIYRGCFAPFDHAWLCWFALTPLIAAVWFSGADAKRRWLRDLLLGYVAGLTFFWSVFSWLTIVTAPGWFLVGAYMGIYFAAWSWLCGALRSSRSAWLSSMHNLRVAFLLASAWVTMELLRATLFSGWGWNMLGSALHAQWALIQIAEFTGVAGLSFLVAFVNVIAVTTIRRLMLERQLRTIKPHYDFALTMLAIAGVIAFGIRAVETRQESRSIRVAAIQPNAPRAQKFNREFAQDTFDRFSRLSQAATQSQPPDLLIWPESSMPEPVLPGTASYRFAKDFAQATKVDLLLGVIDQDQAAVYNAALLVTEEGTREQRYRKVHLVPFGEYVPGRYSVPGLARIVGDQVPADFGFGKEYRVLRMADKELRLAPLICFEDTIGELARQFVLGGANLLANVTNDGWFLHSAESQQHLANAIFRCVETRLPMVRSANTGVTCFIDQFGRITQKLADYTGNEFAAGVLHGNVSVPVHPRQTFYVRHGELFARGCAVVTMLLPVFLLVGFLFRGRMPPHPGCGVTQPHLIEVQSGPSNFSGRE